MRLIVFCVLFVFSFSALANGSPSCADFKDSTENDYYALSRWAEGWFVAKTDSLEKIGKSYQFAGEVWQLCNEIPNITMHDAAKAVYITKDF